MRTLLLATVAMVVAGLSTTATAGSLQMRSTSEQLQTRLNKAIHDKSPEKVKDLSIALLAIEQGRFVMKGNEAIEGLAPNPNEMGKIGRIALKKWLTNEGHIPQDKAKILARLLSEALDGNMTTATKQHLKKEKQE